VGSKVTVFDHAGRVILHTSVSKRTNDIEISALKPGTYIIRLELASGDSFTRKFVKF